MTVDKPFLAFKIILVPSSPADPGSRHNPALFYERLHPLAHLFQGTGAVRQRNLLQKLSVLHHMHVGIDEAGGHEPSPQIHLLGFLLPFSLLISAPSGAALSVTVLSGTAPFLAVLSGYAPSVTVLSEAAPSRIALSGLISHPYDFPVFHRHGRRRRVLWISRIYIPVVIQCSHPLSSAKFPISSSPKKNRNAAAIFSDCPSFRFSICSRSGGFTSAIFSRRCPLSVIPSSLAPAVVAPVFSSFVPSLFPAASAAFS